MIFTKINEITPLNPDLFELSMDKGKVKVLEEQLYDDVELDSMILPIIDKWNKYLKDLVNKK